MTDLEKAARLVVLAFEAHRTHHEHGCVYLDPAIELLRKVILEAEQQEPVAWYGVNIAGVKYLGWKYEELDDRGFDVLPLYTSPRLALWVGLTEEDYVAIDSSCLTKLQAAASTEAILKEKNT